MALSNCPRRSRPRSGSAPPAPRDRPRRTCRSDGTPARDTSRRDTAHPAPDRFTRTGTSSAVQRATRREVGITERLYGPTTLPDSLRGWLTDSYDLSECQNPDLVRTAIDEVVAWLAKPDALPPSKLVALGISDLNPANLIWDGTTCRLADFEDGGLTDPAYELADHVEHLAGRLGRVFNPDALIHAVGLSEADRDRMQAYRPLWAVFWLVMLLPGNGGFRRNPPGTTKAQATHLT